MRKFDVTFYEGVRYGSYVTFIPTSGQRVFPE